MHADTSRTNAHTYTRARAQSLPRTHARAHKHCLSLSLFLSLCLYASVSVSLHARNTWKNTRFSVKSVIAQYGTQQKSLHEMNPISVFRTHSYGQLVKPEAPHNNTRRRQTVAGPCVYCLAGDRLSTI